MKLITRKHANATGHDGVRSSKGASYGLYIKGTKTLIGVYQAERSWGGFASWQFTAAPDAELVKATRGQSTFKTKKDLITAIETRLNNYYYRS